MKSLKLSRAFLVVFVTMSVCPLSCFAVQDSTPNQVDLDWLAGHWLSDKDGRQVEEVWTKQGGGIMLGMNRSVATNRRASFEFLRVEFRSDGVFYVASPGGKTPTEFKLIESTAKLARFENPAHDFPKTITYRLSNNTLQAKIEGTINGKDTSMGWTWSKKQSTIDQVTIAVADVEKSKPFYEAILNVVFISKAIGPNLAVLQAKTGSGLAIQLCPKSIAKVTTSENAIQLRFPVSHVADTFQAAIKHGGKMLQRPSESDGKMHASIRDPDGYSIELIGDRK